MKRYRKMIGDRIIMWFDTLVPIHNMPIYDFIKLLDEQVLVPHRLLEFTFYVYDFSSTGSVCEHDVF